MPNAVRKWLYRAYVVVGTIGFVIAAPSYVLSWWAGRPYPVWEAIPDGVVYLASNAPMIVASIVLVGFALGSLAAGIATFAPARFGYRSSLTAMLSAFGLALGAFPCALIAGAATAALIGLAK